VFPCWARKTCRAARGARALGEVDEITLDVHGTVIERLDARCAGDDRPTTEDEDDEAVAGPIAIARRCERSRGRDRQPGPIIRPVNAAPKSFQHAADRAGRVGAVHAALLTVRFVDPEGFNRVFQDTPLEVILVNAKSQRETRPGKAQAIAQATLAGGGEAEKGRATSPLPPRR
jgi:hypothetical protein